MDSALIAVITVSMRSGFLTGLSALLNLKEQSNNLNPFRLRKTINRRLKKIFDIHRWESLSVNESSR